MDLKTMFEKCGFWKNQLAKLNFGTGVQHGLVFWDAILEANFISMTVCKTNFLKTTIELL